MHPLTLDKAKPLLPVAGKPIIEHILKKIEVLDEIDEIFIVTNNKFYFQFLEWADKFDCLKKIKIVNDGSNSNEERLGAIGDINLVINKNNINDDVLIIAGDNLFESRLINFVNFFRQKNSDIIAVRRVDRSLAAGRYGIIEIDENNRIVGFEEKPQKPKSDLAATCIYLFKKDSISLIKDYLNEGNSKDAPGNFVRWLSIKQPVYCYLLSDKWFDIGNLEQYRIACGAFSKQ